MVETDPAGEEVPPGAIRLLFSVCDTGIGIAPEQLERIFGSFVQADSGLTKKYAGSGLGLAICRRLTRLMGGDVWAESEPGRGSTFRFTAVFDPAENRDPAEQGGPAATESALPPLSILLAEDNRINQLFTEDLLTSRGHSVALAGNGAEALDLLARQPFDLVLMDVQMPVMDGLAATKAIREHAAGLFDPDIPVLGLSAYAIKGDRERFMAAGMDDYLTKPIRFEDFFRVIRRLLDTRCSCGTRGATFDPKRCRTELGVSETTFRRMASLFVADTPERLGCLKASLLAGDRKTARETAHVLAGSAGAVRARVALGLAGRLETALADDDMDTAGPLLPPPEGRARQGGPGPGRFFWPRTLPPRRPPRDIRANLLYPAPLGHGVRSRSIARSAAHDERGPSQGV